MISILVYRFPAFLFSFLTCGSLSRISLVVYHSLVSFIVYCLSFVVYRYHFFYSLFGFISAIVSFPYLSRMTNVDTGCLLHAGCAIVSRSPVSYGRRVLYIGLFNVFNPGGLPRPRLTAACFIQATDFDHPLFSCSGLMLTPPPFSANRQPVWPAKILSTRRKITCLLLPSTRFNQGGISTSFYSH